MSLVLPDFQSDEHQIDFSSLPCQPKSSLNMPVNLWSMTEEDVKKCKDNWRTIEEEHITMASLNYLFKQLSASKLVPNKKTEEQEEDGGREAVKVR